jgi:hypothetical protein
MEARAQVLLRQHDILFAVLYKKYENIIFIFFVQNYKIVERFVLLTIQQ